MFLDGPPSPLLPGAEELLGSSSTVSWKFTHALPSWMSGDKLDTLVSPDQEVTQDEVRHFVGLLSMLPLAMFSSTRT